MRINAPSSSRRFWQFGLRTLLAGVALIAFSLWLVLTFGATWSLLVGWVLLLVAGHVFGNAFGTHVKSRPRDETDQPPEYVRGHAVAYAPTTRLCGEIGLGRAMVAATLIGAALGAALGCWLLWRMAPHLRWYGLAMGSVAMAVIGGLLGFLSSSFVHVGGIALRQATRQTAARSEPDRQDSGPPNSDPNIDSQ